jgi:glycosyltransferase involved in cell wall biosynthesis
MRVCFIEDTELHGGTQIWVAEATRYFLNAGVDVTVLTPESGWVGPRCHDMGARVVTYDYRRVTAGRDEERTIWGAAMKDADLAVCTVHPPRDGFHCSRFAASVIEDFGLTTILVPKTGTIVPEYLREYYHPEEPINFSVVSITRFTQDYLVENYGIPAEKVCLTYQGTDVDLFTRSDSRRAEALKRYSLPAGATPILGNVGSFEERKGQTVLLEAVAEIRQTFPEVHLMLVGDGPDEEKLKQAVETMGLSDNVSFFPFTNEPVYLYEVIDLLVLPSLYKEGLPNVLLEAMSMECPVVASRLAGIPEVVVNDETGYMVEPGNARALALSVVKLWSDKKAYANMAANARRLMETGFDKKRQFGAFIDHFQELRQGIGNHCGVPCAQA